MAKNPFAPDNSYVNRPNRNSFDLSYTNHLTFNFGQLVPVMCKEVLPGDTFEIDSALGLRFMPLAFPIQTKVRAHVHFFYQRAKNLWKDFEDFIYGNDRLQGRVLVPPYLAFTGNVTGDNANKSLLQTCSLGDYLGLPTVRYSNPATVTGGRVPSYVAAPAGLLYGLADGTGKFYRAPNFPSVPSRELSFTETTYNPQDYQASGVDGEPLYVNRDVYGLILFEVGFSPLNKCVLDLPKSYWTVNAQDAFYVGFDEGDELVNYGVPSFEEVDVVNSDGTSTPCYRFTFEVQMDSFSSAAGKIGLAVPVVQFPANPEPSNSPSMRIHYVDPRHIDAINSEYGSPLTDSNEYPLSALPFRCYESIYNSFYRDNRNNPLRGDSPDGRRGMPIYNSYLLNTDGGADFHAYSLHNRNWEYDQFTSAVQSPQQGTAPLVGISSTGDVTFAYDGKEYTFSSETADDNDTVVKINVTENVPDVVAKSIVNTVTSGISINDFRNVNAFQRWLETNIRRGLKYKDQTLARWGVSPADSTLDMPEFIGGYSVDVDINTVTNTNGDGSVPLGDYAANANAFGGSKHQIRQYCDQHGFIMAIVSVVPVPVYSQLLPKMFLRSTALDYYSPEFGQIGMQGVPYRELCPLELNATSDTVPPRPTDVFGYQRPWYEYIYSNDEAHGLFRTDFNQFLIKRTFGMAPTLGPDFLTVQQSSLNDVFTVKNQNYILGMVRFNIEAKRPIPSVSIPSL